MVRVREEAPSPRANFSVSADDADAQVTLGALVADLSLEEVFDKAGKRRLPTGQDGHERKAVIDAADPKGNLPLDKSKTKGVDALENGEEPESGDNPSAKVPAPDSKAFKVDYKEVENGEHGANPTAGVAFTHLKEAISIDKKADKHREVYKFMNKEGDSLMDNGKEPKAGTNPSTKVSFPDLKESIKAEEEAEKCREGLVIHVGNKEGVTVSNLKEAFKVEKAVDKYGEVYKFRNIKGESFMDDGREPKAGTNPFAKETLKVRKEVEKCGEGLVTKVKNKEGPVPGTNCSGVTLSNLKEAFKVEEADNFGVVLKFTNKKGDKAGTSAEVSCPDLKGGLTFEEMKSDKFGQGSFKLEKEDKCGEELVVKASSEGLELKKEGLELKTSASSTSSSSDLSGAAARVRAAATKVLEYGSKSNTSMVKSSLSDLRKLISEINIARERAHASRTEDPNPDLTREQNAKAASEFFKVDRICQPPFSTRPRELPPPPGPMRRSSRHDYAARKKGVEPVVWQGVFAVPSNAITGISEIDSRNEVVAELYGCISKLLYFDHHKHILDFLVGAVKPEVKKQLKENIAQIRTECRKLRQEVINLGGRPLNEPMDYWFTTYYNASLL
ncbi:unnamed protein product [Urochloa humidicola]